MYLCIWVEMYNIFPSFLKQWGGGGLSGAALVAEMWKQFLYPTCVLWQMLNCVFTYIPIDK